MVKLKESERHGLDESDVEGEVSTMREEKFSEVFLSQRYQDSLKKPKILKKKKQKFRRFSNIENENAVNSGRANTKQKKKARGSSASKYNIKLS